MIDCNNSDIGGLDLPNPDPARPGLRFAATVPSLAERLAADMPAAQVVKAFNTIAGELERAQLVEAVADFIRYQIIAIGQGQFTTISMHLVPTQ